MSNQTFNDLHNGKYGATSAFIKGKITIKGSLVDLKNFNSKVVGTYFDKKLNPK